MRIDKIDKMVVRDWTRLASILVFLPGILSLSQNKEDSINDQVGISFTLFDDHHQKLYYCNQITSFPLVQQVKCEEFEEAGFFCVPDDYCNESGIIKANFSQLFHPRY